MNFCLKHWFVIMVDFVEHSILRIKQPVAVRRVCAIEVFLVEELSLSNFRFHWSELSISLNVYRQCHMFEWWSLYTIVWFKFTFILLCMRMSQWVSNIQKDIVRFCMEYLGTRDCIVRRKINVHRIFTVVIVLSNVMQRIHVRLVISIAILMVLEHAYLAGVQPRLV